MNAVPHPDPAPPALPPVVSAQGLRKTFRGKQALDGVDLEIPAGRIVGLIGPNGAGKTTALKALLGLIPYRGTLRVLGMDPCKDRDALMRQVSFIADVAVLPRWIRVREAIAYVEGVHPGFDRARCEAFLTKTKLDPKMRVREMSKGMIVQLHLALVMAIDARLLVLDEPTLGLDILYRKQFYQDLLEQYFDHQRTIIVTTHQVEEIQHILTDLVFIRDGRIALDVSMDAVGQRFVEVMVPSEESEPLRALGAMDERRVFGKSVFLFDRDALPPADAARLSTLGELRTPGIADLFVATMKGTYA